MRRLRRRTPRIRPIALPLAAIVAVYFLLTHFNAKGTHIPVDPQQVELTSADMALSVDMAPVAPQTAAIAPAATVIANEAVTAPVAVQTAPEPEKATALAKVEAGISKVLESGSALVDTGKKVAIAKGDTLMDVLVRNRVPRAQAHEAIAALSKVYDPKDLNPGRKITVYFHQDPEAGNAQFRGIALEKDLVNTLHVNRADDGSYAVKQEEKSVEKAMRGARGVINSSLYESAESAGVPDGVILDMIKMYSMGVDFQRDLHQGDKFEVMYEEYKTEDGKVIPNKGKIVYAKLDLSDRSMPFYRYTDASGDSDYYDEKGQGSKKPLMKTPIDGARLSSGFGMRRHPVLGYSKMHKGIDFAAPRGTPIYAAGDGVIEKLGPFSSYGNYVRIRHRSGLETAYAHMNAFKAGLRSGAKVKQGQVIGYVGTTGRSTGAHLHYEIMLNNKQVNPLSVKLAGGKALAGKDLKKFKSAVASIDKKFNSLGRPVAVASR